MEEHKTLTFEENGLSTSDITPEELRDMLGLPRVCETKIAYRGNGGWRQTSNSKGIANMDTGQLYQISSKDYRLVKHEDGIMDIMKAIERNPGFGRVTWSVNDYDHGKRIHARGVFLDIANPIGKNKGDLIHPTIEYFNSLDGSWSEKVIFGAFRVVCSNGLIMGEKFYQASAIHTEGVDRRTITVNLSDRLHDFSVQTGVWEKWLDRQISLGHLNLIEGMHLTSDNRSYAINEVSDNPEMDLWMFYNLITFIITHRMSSLNRQVHSWNRLRSETSKWI